ncbi:MAG: 16S rRNA (adenine(1518)-N(6)/adenine(1519)-N(6))-dimethyltransferase RsmA [Patescibacteria group bacterium]|jgi:16S rRNA (adenine1518-N6/adenine1519-N6)-dimethyltransferase
MNRKEKRRLRRTPSIPGLKPKKHLSQNFLMDDEVLESIVDAADLQPNDQILEIGAGTGILTQALVPLVQRVVAVEIDESLLPGLHKLAAAHPNLTILPGDIMQLGFAVLEKAFSRVPYKVVANVPYHITSAIIKKFLDSPAPPTSLTLLVQAEVAERICALPGHMSLLSLSVQLFGEPAIVAKVPATAFWPAPDVDSAVLHIDTYAKPLFAAEVRQKIFTLAKAGFANRRKTLANSLSSSLRTRREIVEKALKILEIEPLQRAQELTLDQWAWLTTKLDV